MEEDSSVLLLRLPAHKKDDHESSSDRSTVRSDISIEEDNRSSDKSTIRSDGSIEEDRSSDREEDETKKRKLEFGEEEDSDEEYDSSDDDETTTPITKEEEKADIVSSNDFLDEYGLDDEDLIEMMDADYRLGPDQKQNLLPNIRRYLKSIYDSEAYDSTGFTRVVFGVTSWIPVRDCVFNMRHRYPEGYHHLVYMSSLALDQHNQKYSTQYKVLSVAKANCFSGKGHQYKITFSAVWESITDTFEAAVWDDVVSMKMVVYSCRIKPSTHSSISLNKNLLGQEDSQKSMDENDESDPVERIATLNSYDDLQILRLIGKDPLSAKIDENMLLKKVRKYFDSVVKSQGFRCSYFPGYMPGLTDLKPRQKIIYETSRFPECYFHVCLMAKLSLDSYMKDKGASGLQIMDVESVNSWKESCSSYIYYLTFKARDEDTCDELDGNFEAKVRDKLHRIDVISCRFSP